MLFKYRGFDKAGKRTKGTVSASSPEDAAQKLKSSGIYYDTLLPASKTFSVSELTHREMPGELLSSFSRELSAYLNSGMTILTAIKLMENQHEGEKRYLSFLNSVHTMIDEGKSLYQALNSQTIYMLPDFYIQSLNIAGQQDRVAKWQKY